jgi:spermidine synthase
MVSQVLIEVSDRSDPLEVSVHRHQSIVVHLLFLVSGFCAIVYQVAYQRVLGLFAGSDSISVAIVVGAFLLGLGLGSILASAFVDKLSRRAVIFAFALCEFAIAAFAIVSKIFFYDFLFGRMVALSDDRGLVFLIAFLALLVPTLLMGFSLPLLSRNVARGIDTASEKLSKLFAINTFGAAVGAFVAGFILIGTVGYEITIYFAAVLNVAVGASALLLGWMFTVDRAAFVKTQQTQGGENVSIVAEWCALVFLSGFLAISLEIIWFRIISIALLSSAYTFAIVLGMLLFGDAIGIFIGSTFVRLIKVPRSSFCMLQGAIILVAITTLWVLAPVTSELVRSVARISASRAIVILLAVGSFIVPPAILLGLSFPITQKAVQNDTALIGRRVGLIQFANILGNTAGSVITGLVLLQYIGTTESIRILLGVGFVFTCVAVVESKGSSQWRSVWLAFPVALLILLFGFPTNLRFYAAINLVDATNAILAEDRTGISLLVKKSPTEARLYLGGRVQSTVPFRDGHMVLGLLGPLIHPNPQSALVVGLGTGGTAYAAGSFHTIKRVKVVEILATHYTVMREFAALGGYTGVERYLVDKRYELTVGDARHVLFTDPEKYDLIESAEVFPNVSNSGFIYSVEYFRQLRSRLNPGGLCVQWAPTPRIRATFAAAFPYVLDVVDSYRHVMVGSERPIDFNMDNVIDRLLDPDTRTYLAAAQWDADAVVQLFRDRQATVWKQPDDARAVDVNTDLFPKDEFNHGCANGSCVDYVRNHASRK